MKNGFLNIGVLVVVIISIIYMVMKKKGVDLGLKLTRGLRNNNPFNLRIGLSVWLGKIVGTDKDFETFSSLRLGVRAGLINLYNGYFSKGLTLRQIVAKYAPAADNNNEQAYVEAIRKKTGVIGEVMPGKDKWLSIASAIMYHENGMEVMSKETLEQLVIEYRLINYM